MDSSLAIASLASNHHRSSRSTRHKYSSSGPRIAAKASPHARSIAVDGESTIRSLPNLSFDFATVLRNGDAPVGFVRTHTSWAGLQDDAASRVDAVLRAAITKRAAS